MAGVARLGWWWLWCGDTGDRVTGHNCHNNNNTTHLHTPRLCRNMGQDTISVVSEDKGMNAGQR